jgi:hypothetical protein
MRVTGWTVPELRAAPARVVRAHFARIFAGLVWSPALAEAAAGPPPSRGSFGNIGDYAAARQAKAGAIAAQRAVERVLWPEDDDG